MNEFIYNDLISNQLSSQSIRDEQPSIFEWLDLQGEARIRSDAEAIGDPGTEAFDQRIRMFDELHDGLDAVASLVHLRDLNLAGAKITDRGVVKVLDFGIARVFGADEKIASAAVGGPLPEHAHPPGETYVTFSGDGVLVGTLPPS